MSTLAAPRVRSVVGATGAVGEALPVWPVRAGVLLAFTAFGALHWMRILEPAAPGRAWEAVGIVVAMLLGLFGAGRLRGVLRPLAATVVTIAGVALALLAGGAADEYLRPENWGALFAGVGRGIEALPGIRVPYQGVDEWVRLAMGTGGTVLAAAAAALAFWPRAERIGFPALALPALVTLYGVPAVVLDFEHEFVRGALLALLMLAFLRLEKLRVRDAGVAGVAATGVAIVALAAAPALDGDEPWFDYENWALETASAKAVTFDWNHDYSPLDWPRDGRELLRVKARIPAYWKARELALFDGRIWRGDPRSSGATARTHLPERSTSRALWSQRIEVTLRNLRSDSFITAGVTTGVSGEPSYPAGGGAFNAPIGLGKGDSYTADVYTPRPSDRQLRAATTVGYEDWLRSYLTAYLPEPAFPAPGDEQRQMPVRVSWPVWGTETPPEVDRFGEYEGFAGPALEDSALARTWALAQELKADAATPFEYVERVEAHLDDGFAYSETPPAVSGTLDGFLFDSKIGFCQQFSGAEALLLRMGGVPARVATGFTTGSLDKKQNEYVVRDLDAHSWVEAWFPGYGWVARDPTPAAAPPRSQPGDGSGTTGISGTTPGGFELGGERLGDLASGRAAAPEDATSPTTLVVVGVLGVLALTGAALLEHRRRRRRPPAAQRPMAEFERALRRARLDGGSGRTLTGMEREFSGWPGAVGYVRALREQRYSGREVVPTPEQRRGLRAALARDAGVWRSWWALPPGRGGQRQLRR